MTALAIMQLVEQGQIDLDAPVQRYLPWFQLADADAAMQITVQQLLNHTSGIPGTANYDSFLDPGVSLATYAHQLATVRPNRPVGSSYEYSNANYNLLGLIVETVSRQRYADYMRQHVFTPLGMTHTTLSAEEEEQLRLAQGFKWFFGLGPFPVAEPFNQANLPAGYISSTVEDLSHYLIAHMNKGQYGATSVLSPAGIARMHTAGPNTQQTAPSGVVAEYGMGWAVTSQNGVPIVEHDGETWTFKSLQVMDLQNGLGMILLLNATNQLPSMDEPYRTLSRGIVSRIEGWNLESTGPNIRMQYLMPDAVVVVGSVMILWGLLGLMAWKGGIERRLGSPEPRWRTVVTVARIAVEVLIPAIVLFALPSLLRVASWPLLLTLSTDLALWTLVAAVLVLCMGLAHAALLTRVLYRNRLVHPKRTTVALRPSLP